MNPIAALRRLVRDDFVRKVATLSGGTASAQLISIAALPILTRLYSTEAMGILAVYTAIVSMITVVSCLRYNIAIPLAKTEEEAWAVFCLSAGISFVLSAVLFAGAIAAPDQLSEIIGQPTLAPYIWLMPVSVLAGSLYNALQHWSARKQRYSALSLTRVTQAACGSATQIGLGLLQIAPLGLLLGSVLNVSMGITRLWRDLIQQDIKRPLHAIHGGFIRSAKKAHWRLPLYSVPEALFNTGGMQVPLLLIAAFADVGTAAQLFVAMKIMAIPSRLLAQSASLVFFGEGSKKNRADSLKLFTYTALMRLVAVGVLPILLLGSMLPVLLPFVLGESWAQAGWIAFIMTPWIILQFLANATSGLLHISSKIGLSAIIQALGFMLRVIPTWIAGIYYSGYMVEVYVISSAFFYLTYIVCILRIARDAR